MRIELASVPVQDQEHALHFYTRVLGFEKKIDLPIGSTRWITVVSPQRREGVQLVLEPMGHAAAPIYQKALREAGVPWTAFAVDDLDAQHARLRALGVRFVSEPSTAGDVRQAVLDDTCGNLIQLYQVLA
jgi:catechol 2,3-dioxygenase-like lactoylglutathione lyase family enzyme